MQLPHFGHPCIVFMDSCLYSITYTAAWPYPLHLQNSAQSYPQNTVHRTSSSPTPQTDSPSWTLSLDHNVPSLCWGCTDIWLCLLGFSDFSLWFVVSSRISVPAWAHLPHICRRHRHHRPGHHPWHQVPEILQRQGPCQISGLLATSLPEKQSRNIVSGSLKQL